MRELLRTLFAAALFTLPQSAASQTTEPPLRGGVPPHEAQRPDPGADEAQMPLDEETAEELSSQATADPGSLHLLSAAGLLDRPVTTRAGDQVGSIRFLLIDADDGQARFAIAERAGGKGLIAIPWRSLDVPSEANRPVVALAAAERLAAAPALPANRLGDLTQPRVITEITEYYRPPGGPSDERSQPIGAPGGYLVVTRDVIGAVTAPGAMPDTALKNTMVASAKGDPIGRIDQVVLDAERGRISYVVVAREGAQTWLPLPFEPLHWQADTRRFTLDTDQAQLAQLPTLRQDDVKQGLDEQSVAEIYDQFGIEPYWQ